jgi:divalent metal cation (Fe/Co/Zn/Cd) transporter
MCRLAITQLWWLAAAGIISFLGNASRSSAIRVGREIDSAALIADGHARTDGLKSLAVVLRALGVWAGYLLADLIVSLLITIAIFGIVWPGGTVAVI